MPPQHVPVVRGAAVVVLQQTPACVVAQEACIFELPWTRYLTIGFNAALHRPNQNCLGYAKCVLHKVHLSRNFKQERVDFLSDQSRSLWGRCKPTRVLGVD